MSTTQYVSTGDLIDYTPGSAASAGDIVVQSELVGQVVGDIKANKLGALRIEGVISVPKHTDTVAAGDWLYWDAGNTRATTTASTHKRLGKAVEAAASGVATVKVKLLPGAVT